MLRAMVRAAAIDSAPAAHTPLGEGFSGAGIRGPSLTTVWAIVFGGEGVVACPRAADEKLVGIRQGVSLGSLPSRKGGADGA